jgi:iron(III) transport system substrate-binding protein
MLMKKLALAGVAMTMTVATAFAQKTALTVYTALENDQLKIFKDEIEKAVPEVDIQWVRDSTGVITARVLAEKAAPKADLVLGLAASSMMLFNKEGLLASYKPQGSEKLKPGWVAADGTWTGMDAFLNVVCFNTVEAQKAGATAPKAWKDLLDPKLKDKIVMPHPASSGTGYMLVAAWIQMMGEEQAWKFMDGLHQNVGVYTHSGSAPCVQAAKGERIAGLGFDMRGAREKTNGAPLDLIVPSDGTGWEMEASGMMKATQKAAAAQKVLDWVASKPANELFSKYYALTAHPEVKNLPPNYPADGEAKMAKIDLQKMADDRARILAEWSKRYESKAAPKN